MAITLTYTPSPLNTTRNPIAYTLQTDDTEVSFAMKVFIETVFGSDSFEEIRLLEHPQDKEGKATFFVNEFLEKKLSYDLPNLQNLLPQKATKVCRKAKVAIAEFTVPTVADDLVFTDQAEFQVLKSGRQFVDWRNRVPNFPIGRNILTTRPYTREISPLQHEYLYLFSDNTATYQFTFRVNYLDGTNAQIVKTYNLIKYEPLMVNVGYAALGYEDINPTKTIVSITISSSFSKNNPVISTSSCPGATLQSSLGVSYSGEFYGDLRTGITSGQFRLKLLETGAKWENFGYTSDRSAKNLIKVKFCTDIGFVDISTNALIDIDYPDGNVLFCSGTSTLPDNYHTPNLNFQILIETTSGGEDWIDQFGFPTCCTQTQQTQQSVQQSVEPSFTMIPMETYCLNGYREIYYINSLGGLDSLVCTGIGEESLKNDFGEFKHFYDAQYNISDGEFAKYNINNRKEVKVTSGFKSMEEFKAAHDIFHSPRVFIREGEQLIPINVKDTKSKPHKDNDFLAAIEFTYQYAFNQIGIRY